MPIKIVISLDLKADCEYCNDCQFLTVFHTGMIGEFHPKCNLFDICGEWGETNMKRCRQCKDSQIRYEKLKRKTV